MLKSISNCLGPVSGDTAVADEVHALVAAFYNLIVQSYTVWSCVSGLISPPTPLPLRSIVYLQLQRTQYSISNYL